MSNPRLTRGESSSPAPERSLLEAHEQRLNSLDGQVLELRQTSLPKTVFNNRRKIELDHIGREFEGLNNRLDRIEHHVDHIDNNGALRADVEFLKSNVNSLGSTFYSRMYSFDLRMDKFESGMKTLQSSLNSGINSLESSLYPRVERLESSVHSLKSSVHRLESSVHSLESSVHSLESNVHSLELFMKQADSIDGARKHNAFAHKARAYIKPVAVMDDDTAELQFPRWFPGNVAEFWALTDDDRVEHLVELAEFYQLAGYQYWGTPCPSRPSNNGLTRAEAVRKYGDEALQALAATLGLNLSEIIKEIGFEILHPRKRQQDVASMSSRSQTKMARRDGKKSASTDLSEHRPPSPGILSGQSERFPFVEDPIPTPNMAPLSLSSDHPLFSPAARRTATPERAPTPGVPEPLWTEHAGSEVRTAYTEWSSLAGHSEQSAHSDDNALSTNNAPSSGKGFSSDDNASSSSRE